MKHKRKIHQKTDYATELQVKKAMRELEIHKQGFDFACYLATVGLNELYGFGYERIKRLEEWMQDVMDNEFHNDVEVATAALIRRIDQIIKRKGEADGEKKVANEENPV